MHLDVDFQEVMKGQGFIAPSIIESLAKELQANPHAVLLTSRKARMLVNECLKIRGVSNFVMAHEEIVPEIACEALGIIPGGYDEALAA